MSQLQRYVDQYGPLAGPKVYHAIRSRSAYIGVSQRRRRALAALTGRPLRDRTRPKPAGAMSAMLPGLAEARDPVAAP